MKVKCLAQGHNAMTPARTRTRSARSGVERTNHEANAPPQRSSVEEGKSQILVIDRLRVLESGPHNPTRFFLEVTPSHTKATFTLLYSRDR